ncbi:MAG: hypothetical protein J0I07_16580 [Myxococcales bacterium]|nr:hypothetical protein [Myxococcales bacterium]
MRSGVRSPSAPQSSSFVFVAAILVAGTACNTSGSPAKDAQYEKAADSGALLVAGDAAPAPGPSACSSDGDCRTWSSYCHEAPCVCRVLAKSDPDLRCSGAGNVSCFADPCMNKTAACQEGRCVLVMGSKQ